MILNPDKVYYFASPYSSKDPVIQNQRYLEQQRLVAHLIKDHELSIINPIEMCHEMSKRYGLPSGYEFWQKRDKKLISISDGIVVALMPGWDVSVGVSNEIAYAISISKEVWYLDPHSLKVSKKP